MVKGTRRRSGLFLSASVWLALSVLTPLRPAAAVPSTDCDPASSGDVACGSAQVVPAQPDGTENVGTAVYVVMHGSFTATPDADQCVGASALAAIHRDASVILSEGSSYSSASRQVAVGDYFRSRMRDGICEVLYVISAPVTPAFNVQFVDRAGERSPTYGPVPAESVTDQPGILQAVRVDLAVVPQP
jgi:hypothetical protein